MDPQDILDLAARYQEAAVLAAAAELDVFAALATGPLDGSELALCLGLDRRGATILLDALVALGLLGKEGNRYRTEEVIGNLLGRHGPGSVLAMARHQANCMRRWAQLAWAVKTGTPPERKPSIRGEDEDRAAFIEAMDNVSAPVADEVVRDLGELAFERLLDVGGASGSWTAAFLRLRPEARATIFDLPEVVPMARERLAAVGLLDRVDIVEGDYLKDPLPPGADLAWVSAIVHQNSRDENRLLFERIFESLRPGGRVLVRDIVMDPSRTVPIRGALFAVNMLVGTEGGGTYTFEELREDLGLSGFRDVRLEREDPGMSSVVGAAKALDPPVSP
jgi:SAM-dependent methyltransferase